MPAVCRLIMHEGYGMMCKNRAIARGMLRDSSSVVSTDIRHPLRLNGIHLH